MLLATIELASFSIKKNCNISSASVSFRVSLDLLGLMYLGMFEVNGSLCHLLGLFWLYKPVVGGSWYGSDGCSTRCVIEVEYMFSLWLICLCITSNKFSITLHCVLFITVKTLIDIYIILDRLQVWLPIIP